jgi:hypothetical protein
VGKTKIIEQQLPWYKKHKGIELYPGIFEKFKEALESKYYDFRVLKSINWVIKRTKEKYGVKINKSSISELCQLKLLDFRKDKNGSILFPLFIPERIAFIKTLQSKFNYTTPMLQQIIAIEDRAIRSIPLLPPRYKSLFEQVKGTKKGRQGRKRDEFVRIFWVGGYHNQLLQGYSPQVRFKGALLQFNNIDWEETLRLIREVDSPIDLDFFRTPYFLIGWSGKNIIIEIVDPGKVNADMMQTIVEKVYTVFRSKSKFPRKRWGKKTGRRFKISWRNRYLRMLYQEMRKREPLIPMYRLMRPLVEWTEIIGYGISIERVRKIVHSRK